MGKRKDLVCGFGINDYEGSIKENHKVQNWYTVWHNMIQRCFDPNVHKNEEWYIGCTVCEEWRYLSNFKRWYDEHYIEGYALDKDLIAGDKREYSPANCVFLPREINNLLEKKKPKKNGLPQGVYKYNNMYCTHSGRDGKHYAFDNIENASEAYYRLRREKAKELAIKYKGKIEERAFNALMDLRLR